MCRRLEGEETLLKCRCVCGSCTEKFSIVSNDHGRMHKCDFSIFEWKHPFWANLVKKKVKTASVSWNLVLRLIRICRIQWCCSLFPFLTWNTLFGQSWSKKSVPRLIWICRIQWWYSLFCFRSETLFFGQISSKKSKIVSLSWNLLPRLIRIYRI